MSISLARKSLSVFVTNWLLFPLQLVTGVLVVRSLGAEGKGLLVILTTSVALLAALGAFGLPAAGVYFSRSGIYSERTLVVNYLIVVALVSLIVTGTAFRAQQGFSRVFLDGKQIESYLVALTLAELPLMLLSSFLSLLVLAAGRTKDYAWLTIGAGVFNISGTLLLVVIYKLGVAGALIAILFSQLIVLTSLSWKFWKTSSDQACEVHPKILINMFKYGLQHYIGTVGSQMFKRADNFLLAYFLDIRAVGYYSVALTGYDALLSIPRAIIGLLAGEATSQKAEEAAETVARSGRYLLWLMLTASLSISILSPWIVPILYGTDFSRSVPPLIILLMAAVLLGLTTIIQAYFLSVNKPAINGTSTALAGGINLALSLWLIPLAGLPGDALATFIGSMANLSIHLFWFRRLSKTPLRDVFLLRNSDFEMIILRLRNVLHRAGFSV
jgi:O-antigen/teichoic acid export membrane protein